MTGQKDSLQTDFKLTPEDREAVMRTCLDYVDGWYTADVERMTRSLHPELIKRTLRHHPDQGWELGRVATCTNMIEWTRAGGGSHLPLAARVYDISIRDGFRHIACATALSPEYMDYIQLAKLGDRWVIVHVLWELRGEGG